ncbi:MAG: type II toxin-antitoxin system RelE/ParE family toxin [Opitutaceae bacterium]|nr:type II toxin-antitoxin system RelE/ParE family toxin [Opitutaceae bacterium]
MDFKVGLTDEALADLRSIVEYIARDSAEASSYVGNELIATAESLSVLPHRGAPVKERGDMRKVFRWHYAIYHRVKEAERRVEVLRVWDTRRDPRELVLPR